MAQNIDKLFLENITRLIREVLSDEAKFVSKNDQTYASLHSHMFSKGEETSFANIPEAEKAPFRKYFYVGDQPRGDVPFSDSPDAQSQFFNNLRTQIRFCTYNYDRMDYLRPSFSSDEDLTPEFSGSQTNLLLMGVIYPVIHKLESQEIARLEMQQGKKSEEKGANPYQSLGDKILVKGISGEFDTVLSFSQIQEIADQEKMLKNQEGLSQEEIVRLLNQFISQRFPNLKLYLSPEGKIITYLGASGISAQGTGERQKDLSFTELIREMKVRQCRDLQYQSIIASKGTLGFGQGTFQVTTGDGTSTTMDGHIIGIDQGGKGNNGVFFLTDRQGVSARFTVDTAEHRITGSTNFNLKIYETPDTDSPVGPKIKLAHDRISRLQTPLMVLYGEVQKEEGYRTVPGLPRREAVLEGKGAPKEDEGTEVPEAGVLPLTAGNIRTEKAKEPILPMPPAIPVIPKTASTKRTKNGTEKGKRKSGRGGEDVKTRRERKHRQRVAQQRAGQQPPGHEEAREEEAPAEQQSPGEQGQRARKKKKNRTLLVLGASTLAAGGAIVPGIIKLFI